MLNQGGKIVKLVLLAVTQMSLSSGCAMLSSPQNAAKLSNPSLEFETVKGRGAKFKAGSEFNGKLKGKYDATTGSFDIDTEISSSPSPVIAAESERAQVMFQLYQIQAAAHTADMKMFTDIITSAINTVPSLLTGLPLKQALSSGPQLSEILALVQGLQSRTPGAPITLQEILALLQKMQEAKNPPVAAPVAAPQ